MEVVTIEKATFEEIQNEVIEAISMAESLLSKFKPNHPKWLDNENVCRVFCLIVMFLGRVISN